VAELNFEIDRSSGTEHLQCVHHIRLIASDLGLANCFYSEQGRGWELISVITVPQLVSQWALSLYDS